MAPKAVEFGPLIALSNTARSTKRTLQQTQDTLQLQRRSQFGNLQPSRVDEEVVGIEFLEFLQYV